MDCRSCGQENPDRAKFCLECGAATGEPKEFHTQKSGHTGDAADPAEATD